MPLCLCGQKYGLHTNAGGDSKSAIFYHRGTEVPQPCATISAICSYGIALVWVGYVLGAGGRFVAVEPVLERMRAAADGSDNANPSPDMAEDASLFRPTTICQHPPTTDTITAVLSNGL